MGTKKEDRTSLLFLPASPLNTGQDWLLESLFDILGSLRSVSESPSPNSSL